MRFSDRLYGLKLFLVVIYGRGSQAVAIKFFTDLSDIFEHLSRFSTPVVVGDLNQHLDISESADTIKFNSLFEANNYRQYAESAILIPRDIYRRVHRPYLPTSSSHRGVASRRAV